MAQEFLDRADVVAVFEQVSREGMAKGMWGGVLADAGSARGDRDRALDGTFVEVMAAQLAGIGVQVTSGRGKEPLPRPFARRTRVLPTQGVGERDGAVTRTEVRLVLRPDTGDVLS